MVRGLDIFRKYFENFPENYIIIGGTACDILLDEAGFIPRATKDIDIILIIEALSKKFIEKFWEFIEEGRYRQREKSSGKKEYYRFLRPEVESFPYQLELFSRTPDSITLKKGMHLTRIPVAESLLSLSAILMDQTYYSFIMQNSHASGGLHLANIESLICLKAKAFLEINERLEKGQMEETKQLKKHKADIFRLITLLEPVKELTLPELIQADLNDFITRVEDSLPDEMIFREMGLRNIELLKLFNQFKNSFRIS